MKMIITKEQRQHLAEQELLGYTPQRIDSFLQQGQKDLAFFQEQYQKFYSQMMGVSVHDAFEDMNGLKALLDTIKSAEVRLNKLATTYFDIVDKYDFMNLPPNVKELDKIYNELETLSYDIGSVKDIVEAVYDSVEHFIKWNKNNKNIQSHENNTI